MITGFRAGYNSIYCPACDAELIPTRRTNILGITAVLISVILIAIRIVYDGPKLISRLCALFGYSEPLDPRNWSYVFVSILDILVLMSVLLVVSFSVLVVPFAKYRLVNK